MTHSIKLLSATAILAAALSGPLLAQGAPQTLAMMNVDVKTLATGYRSTKMVGSTVVNEMNETVGTIDDLIITRDDKVPFAVLSVGGFLGIGSKYIVVPSSAMEVKEKTMLLRGATKESLLKLPAYTYAN